MRLDSVRSVKRELYDPLAGEARPRAEPPPGGSLPAGRADDVAMARPGVALGVAAGATADDYRLAVRIQRRDLVGSSTLEAIQQAARNEVDVRYIGLLRTQAQRQRVRPVRIGYSVGHTAITAGTIGAFVRTGSDSRPRLLSNNHVLADENRGAVGDAILQPGRSDGGEDDLDRVATLERFHPLDPTAVNHVDAAVALLLEDVELSTRMDELGVPDGVTTPEEVIDVAKVGRTTGLTRGAITAIEVDNVIVDFSTAQLRFDDQIEVAGTIEPFSMGGDSGSLIVDAGTSQAVGLLFAGSELGGPGDMGVTYANPLAEVFDRLDVEGLW